MTAQQAPTGTPLPPELESLLVEHLREERNGLRNGGIVGAILMLGIAAIAWFALDPPQRNLWVLAAVAAPLMLLLAIPSFFDPRRARSIQTLRTRSGAIVWMYVRMQRGQAAGSWIVCGLEDGTSVQVTAKMGQEDTMLRALTQLAPTATFGFSPELAARFKSAPASLRKSA